ncbi:OprD family outer membrane porin, partial [Corynebacterium diphtheriae]
YISRDYKDGGKDKAEWGQGFIGKFESGFTQGTVGVGVDVIGQYAIRLDGGKGRSGAGGINFFKQGDSGAAPHDLAKGGAAVKARISNTVLKYGDYISRDYKDGGKDKAEWGQGFIGKFESGFTQGTV